MASQQRTVDFIMDQLSDIADTSARKMFGEYAIFCNGRMVALICNDELFVKRTAAGKALVADIEEKPPYPGAKPCFFISGDRWDDREWLSRLVIESAAELPLPKKKTKRTSRIAKA